MEVQKEQTVQNLNLSDIKPDKNQPRKTQNKLSLELLSQSIKEVGVLQPITVRVSGKGYVIVMGERRYLASKMAKKKTIRCIVQEFDSSLISEIQIIENLQRQDVEPIEEAEAIAELLKKYNVSEIAKRIGRTAPFIYSRVKLANLIEGFRVHVRTKEMTLSLAVSAATFPKEEQEEILASMGETFYAHQVKNSINQKVFDLERAPFDLNDTKLVEKAGACSKCPFNTLNEGSLFGEGKQICTRISCFTNKKSKHLIKLIEDCKKENVLLIGDFYTSRRDEETNMLFVSILEENEFEPILKDDLQFVKHPVKPTLESVKKQYQYYNWSEEAFKGELENQLEAFKRKTDNYEQARKDGFQKAIFVNTTSYHSEEVLAMKKHKSERSPEKVKLGEKKMSECTPKERIEKIKLKSIRKEELESEREFKAISEAVKESDYTAIRKELTKDEMVAFCISFYENAIEWQQKDKIKGFYTSRSKSKEKIVEVFKNNFKKETFNQLVRIYLLQGLHFQERSHHNDVVNNSFYKALKTYCKKEMELIEAEYTEARTKREKRKEERIKELSK